MSGLRRKLLVLTILPILMIPLLLLCGCDDPPYGTPAAGTTVRYDFISTADGLNLPCSIYLPSGYDPNQAYPMWVELHALEGIPLICNNPFNFFSNSIRGIADQNKWIILSPWGRSIGSFYMDGVKKDSGVNREPKIVDDMSSLSAWRVTSGNWTPYSGIMRQGDASASWKELVRTGSYGQDYAVRVRFREVSRNGSSAMGVDLRRDPATGDCYHVDLYTEDSSSGPLRYVRLFKYTGGAWNLVCQTRFDWQPLKPLDTWITLKVTSYAGYVKVFVNDIHVNLQGDDTAPYGLGRDLPDPPLAGEVSLASYGGVHEFDEVRVENELEYGERDVLDCTYQAMEKFNVDDNRIYVSGLSMGGTGAYILGIHNPGLFAAISPNAGASDLVYDYDFIKAHFPVNPGPPYAMINDARVCDIWRLIAGMEHNPGQALDTPLMKDCSARYTLENLANTPVRIVQGNGDSNFPNDYGNLIVMWWVKDNDSAWWYHTDAPAPYSPATATFANGGDIYNLLNSWSSQGPDHCEYSTSPYGGHGYMEPYDVTTAFFRNWSVNRHPARVACKTYDDATGSAYWLKLRRHVAAGNQASLARAEADTATNTVSAHARNAEELTLDLMRAGMDGGAGKTITVNLDAATDPSAMPVIDVLGSTSLNLLDAWPPVALQVRLDGVLLQEGVEYTRDGVSLRVPSVALGSRRVLSVTIPATLPGNLLANAGFEGANPDGSVAGWIPVTDTGGSARYERNGLQSHTGTYSLRIKDPAPAGSPYVAAWSSQPVTSGIVAGKRYRFYVSYKTRMFEGGSLRAAINWYNASGDLLGSSQVPLEAPAGYSNHGWYQAFLEAQAPAGSAACTVRLETVSDPAGQAGGSVFFDDAALYQLP